MKRLLLIILIFFTSCANKKYLGTTTKEAVNINDTFVEHVIDTTEICFSKNYIHIYTIPKQRYKINNVSTLYFSKYHHPQILIDAYDINKKHCFLKLVFRSDINVPLQMYIQYYDNTYVYDIMFNQ